MFKYVSEIISQFSKSQKILALLILCFSIILVTVLPSFISSITIDRDELVKKIEGNESKIKVLSIYIDKLDSTLISNQKKCTDDAFKRELDFKKMLQEIQDELIVKNYRIPKILNTYKIDKDTISSLSSPEPIYPVVNLDNLIKKVENMRNQIEKR